MNDKKYKLTGGNRRLIGYERMICSCEEQDDTAYRFDSLRIAHMIGGGADWLIGNHLYPVFPGNIVILNSLEVRTIVNCHPPGPLIMDIFSFFPSAVEYDEECLRVFCKRANMSAVLRANCKEVYAVLEALRREIISPEGSFTLAHSLLICLTIALGRIAEKNTTTALKRADVATEDNTVLIAKAAAYICNHFCEPLTAETLARRFAMSVAHFQRLFHRQIGVTVREFINQRRVERVIRLLQTSNRGVLESAFECGFRTSSGFYHTFKAMTGFSPKESLLRSVDAVLGSKAERLDSTVSS